MSSLILLSIEEKKDILNKLFYRRSKKFNKEHSKILRIIEQYSFLKGYKERLNDLKSEFQAKLQSVNTSDVDWEVHEKKGAEIEKEFNDKLLNIKYEINTILDSYNDLKELYNKYEKVYDELKNLKDSKKYKDLISEIKKMDFLCLENIQQIKSTKQKIEEELEKLQEIQKRYEVLSAYDFNNFTQKRFVMENEFDTIMKKIEKLSQKEYKRIKNLETDKKLKLKEAKVIYQRLVYSKIFKDEIDAILKDLPTNLYEEFEKLKQQEIIDKKTYEKLMNEYYNQKSEDISVDKIVDAFEKLGYRFEDVVLNEKGYIDTDKNEYKLAYRIENGKLALAFTRFVDKDTKINEYEREKDRKMAKKWCSDFEKIAKLLESEGIKLNKEIIKEPDEIDVQYEIVEKTQNIKSKKVSLNKKGSVK